MKTRRAFIRAADLKFFLRRPATILLLNLVIVGVVGYLALNRDKYGMYWGDEGVANWVASRDQFIWMPFGIAIGMIPTVGAGVTGMPFNTLLMPAFIVQDIFCAGDIRPVPTYLIMSLELFTSIFFLGRALRVGNIASVSAGWIILLQVTPFVRPMAISFPTPHIVPLFIEVIAAACLGGAIFLSIGRSGAIVNAALCAAWTILIGWLAASNLTMFPLAVPCFAAFAGAGVIGAATRAEFWWKVACIPAALAALAAGGFPQDIIGSYRDTATNFFVNEFVAHSTDIPIFISILFHGNNFSPVGPTMAVLGFLGCAAIVLWSRPAQRRRHLVLLAGVLSLVGGGYGLTHVVKYEGPKFLYFEYPFWPLYALWAAWLIVRILRWLVSIPLPAAPYHYAAEAFGSLLVGVAGTIAVYSIAPEPTDFGYLHHTTPIIDYFIPRIEERPGLPFRGRVATFTGYLGQPPGINWFNLDDVVASQNELGNDHRFSGLWYYRIPALFEDSAFTSPAIYAIASRLLARPGDRQLRNIMLFTNPNPKVLQFLGVRYVVTDNDALAVGQERVVLPWPNHNRRIRVLELPDPNLGQYSPTEIVLFNDWHEVIRALGDGLDPKHTVMVDQPLTGEPPVPAEHVQITLEKGFLRVRATSLGRSLLVLPFEYSHCFEVTAESDGAPVRTFRADLVNEGIDFRRTVDVRLALRLGPFEHASCRGADADDMVRLKMNAQGGLLAPS